MIIVQTPLRISFFGGGTDFPSFFKQEGGCVLSTAIDKYIFVTIKKRFDKKLRIAYTKTEMVDNVCEIKHDLIREALYKTKINQGVEVTTMGDIPSEGSGLGSSSTVTVGSLHAMYTYKGDIVPVERLAKEACQIEIDALGKPIGIQDQYIAAFGGLRFMEFLPDGTVNCSNVKISERGKRELNNNFILFFTGVTRSSSSILKEQKYNINNRLPILRQLKELARQARIELESGNIDAMGALMDEGWQLKKQMAGGISNGIIDEIYQKARQAGAYGGKITGAGGGGFLLLYCPYEKQNAVREELKSLQELPFLMENDGTKVIFNYRR